MSQPVSFKYLITSELPVLIFFSQPKCNTCLTMNAILKVVEQQIKAPYDFHLVNLNQYPVIADQYNISRMPTCLLFMNGVFQWKGVGIIPAKTILESFKNLHIGLS